MNSFDCNAAMTIYLRLSCAIFKMCAAQQVCQYKYSDKKHRKTSFFLIFDRELISQVKTAVVTNFGRFLVRGAKIRHDFILYSKRWSRSYHYIGSCKFKIFLLSISRNFYRAIFLTFFCVILQLKRIFLSYCRNFTAAERNGRVQISHPFRGRKMNEGREKLQRKMTQ